MAKIVLFGTGDIAQLAKYYFDNDSEHEVIAFTVDRDYINSDEYEGLPLIPFDEVEKVYPPDAFKMFIALSYAKMNEIREQKYFLAKEKGYELVSYISSKCSYLSQFECGDNCFILEDNTIQPYVKIGKNVTLWSGNHIGHHSIIEDHNFVSSHVVISGHCVVESNCFLGVNATLAHKVRIASKTLLGAGAVIAKDTEELGIYVPPRSTQLSKKSDEVSL
ncbi:MAG: acetyltransferase [Flavobacteriales bacterium]|jgi:sugar O-acyltransferase (sialic acid O-acetyltransferase NeuD family)|nr:acetyltransferase [Flavobacteriales bacterium]